MSDADALSRLALPEKPFAVPQPGDNMIFIILFPQQSGFAHIPVLTWCSAVVVQLQQDMSDSSDYSMPLQFARNVIQIDVNAEKAR